ncbi:MAG: hypothetical protein HZB51_33490 [Chloroflexi bacterium]|nr:hypothetical protein [Chloroflexota bacterium]
MANPSILHPSRAAFILAIFFFAACTVRPIPTATIATQTATLKPQPTATQLPKATNTPIPTPTGTLIPSPTPSSTATFTPIAPPVDYSKNPRAILIEADILESTTNRDAHVPKFRLYADGMVIFAGERATTSTGLDATVRTGKLSDSEIQNLLGYLTQVGFFNLKDYYESRPKPKDAPTASVSVYLTKAKTILVYDPQNETTPQVFGDAFARITQSVPTNAQTFIPTDGYLESTDAGPTSGLTARESFIDWSIPNTRLADAINGITVSGRTYDQIIALRANKPATALYREGDHVYRVRFAPNLPRTVHLSDVLGTILNAPREFDGRVFDITGYFRGWNLLGEASGNPPVTRSDWVIADNTSAMYVTGAIPRGLDASSRDDVWNVVRLLAKVVYVRLGTSYLEVRRVDSPTNNITATATPSATPVPNADAAIASIKSRFTQVSKIQKSSAGMIGASSDIRVFDRADGWDLAFWQGSGDCPSGCINNHYYYFSVKKDGTIVNAGEYIRNYNANANSFDTTGSPLWGYPQ